MANLSASYIVLRARIVHFIAFAAAAAMGIGLARAEEPYAFHVPNQRSVAVTSQYWNPILLYVAQKSGVPLELRLARSTSAGNAAAEQGAYHFVFSNHFFTPEREKLGFRVIARAAGTGIRGQIVVKADSAIRNLQELNGTEVAFGSPDAFAAYWLPMDALLKTKVNVKVVFTHDQDTGLAQLKAGTVAAMAVNESIVQRYARREGFDYRLLWSSDLYNSPCIMASARVPEATLAAVRAAFLNMSADPEGRRILEAGAQLVKNRDVLGFVASSDRDYDNYRAFYKKTLVQAAH